MSHGLGWKGSNCSPFDNGLEPLASIFFSFSFRKREREREREIERVKKEIWFGAFWLVPIFLIDVVVALRAYVFGVCLACVCVCMIPQRYICSAEFLEGEKRRKERQGKQDEKKQSKDD